MPIFAFDMHLSCPVRLLVYPETLSPIFPFDLHTSCPVWLAVHLETLSPILPSICDQSGLPFVLWFSFSLSLPLILISLLHTVLYFWLKLFCTVWNAFSVALTPSVLLQHISPALLSTSLLLFFQISLLFSCCLFCMTNSLSFSSMLRSFFSRSLILHGSIQVLCLWQC